MGLHTKGFELRATKEFPYNLSVGAIIQEGDRYLVLKQSDGVCRFPSETMYSDESIEDALIRGMQEELGLLVRVGKFIGSVYAEFLAPDQNVVKKTTIYFFCTKIGETTRSPQTNEVDDTIIWATKEELPALFDGMNKRNEEELFDRI